TTVWMASVMATVRVGAYSARRDQDRDLRDLPPRPGRQRVRQPPRLGRLPTKRSGGLRGVTCVHYAVLFSTTRADNACPPPISKTLQWRGNTGPTSRPLSQQRTRNAYDHWANTAGKTCVGLVNRSALKKIRILAYSGAGHRTNLHRGGHGAVSFLGGV